MKIARLYPPPPPREFSMTFSQHEGWAIVGALAQYAERHPEAADCKQWQAWAKELDKELRR